MKKKKEEGGPASLGETHYRTLLQEALSFVLPERQAERFTAMLLERFGSFAGVFLAPEEELAALLGERRAPRYLRLTTELARAYLEDSSRDLKHVYDTDSAVELFRPKLLGRTTEAVCLMLLDGQARLLYNDILSEGSISAVPVYIRRLLQLCIRYDAQHVLLAHNHPSGNAAASQNDIVATRQVEMALESIDATLNDHIIFAGDDYHSFAKSGWLWTAKREVRRQRQEELQASREEEREILRRGGLL
ncbi:MAG: JAB domain-containing protein [Acutalibacter sp.]